MSCWKLQFSRIPGSPHYHLEIPPDYVISPRDDFLQAMSQSKCKFYPFKTNNDKRLRVSGISDLEKKSQNLQLITRKLVQREQDSNISIIESIISNLPANRQKALFIVNSYDQVEVVRDEILRLNPELAEKTIVLQRAINDSNVDRNVFTRSEIPLFGLASAVILIAPLQTIERGYNILNSEDKAAFGSVHFLIRPMPHPEDFLINIHKLNGWACQRLSNSIPSVSLHTFGLNFREEANEFWSELFKEKKYFKDLRENARNSLLTDTFALLLQVIGRTIRGNVPTEVYLHDGAFIPDPTDTEIESLLLGIIGLKELLLKNNEYAPLLRILYESFLKLFQRFTEI